ncbi:MAG: DUF2628 domain-containing protein [Gemmatimonadaceae bacterium]|nr:DUF2628 domain-containing protein [Acetobacteraceae bacterium]
MKNYTAHLMPDRAPVLLQEGWSWGAALFGPLWFLAFRAWVPAALFAGAIAVVQLLVPPGAGFAIGLGFVVLAGLMGRDVLRWSLEQRGYVLEHVLAARDEEGALARLLHARTDLHETFLEPVK